MTIAATTLDDDLAGCRAAHAALQAAIVGLTDAQAGAASALPGWSVGHVLTHLARNADANRGVLEAARRGEVGSMYASTAQRDTDIAAGAHRPAAELRADLGQAIAALEAAWAAAPAEAWATGRARGPAGEFPLAQTVWRRWREVCVHHGDLDRGFDPTPLASDYLTADLPRLLADVTDRLDLDGRRQLAAWLLGRRTEPGPLHLSPWIPSR